MHKLAEDNMWMHPRQCGSLAFYCSLALAVLANTHFQMVVHKDITLVKNLQLTQMKGECIVRKSVLQKDIVITIMVRSPELQSEKYVVSSLLGQECFLGWKLSKSSSFLVVAKEMNFLEENALNQPDRKSVV